MAGITPGASWLETRRQAPRPRAPSLTHDAGTEDTRLPAALGGLRPSPRSSNGGQTDPSPLTLEEHDGPNLDFESDRP